MKTLSLDRCPLIMSSLVGANCQRHVKVKVNNNNNNNKHEDIYSAVIMAEPLREFTRFTR